VRDDDERDDDDNNYYHYDTNINVNTSGSSSMGSTTTSTNSGSGGTVSGVTDSETGSGGIIMPQVNAHSATLLLNRKNWSLFQFGDVMVNVEEPISIPNSSYQPPYKPPTH
jgi:hypothetical protein